MERSQHYVYRNWPFSAFFPSSTNRIAPKAAAERRAPERATFCRICWARRHQRRHHAMTNLPAKRYVFCWLCCLAIQKTPMCRLIAATVLRLNNPNQAKSLRPYYITLHLCRPKMCVPKSVSPATCSLSIPILCGFLKCVIVCSAFVFRLDRKSLNCPARS